MFHIRICSRSYSQILSLISVFRSCVCPLAFTYLGDRVNIHVSKTYSVILDLAFAYLIRAVPFGSVFVSLIWSKVLSRAFTYIGLNLSHRSWRTLYSAVLQFSRVFDSGGFRPVALWDSSILHYFPTPNSADVAEALPNHFSIEYICREASYSFCITDFLFSFCKSIAVMKNASLLPVSFSSVSCHQIAASRALQ